jgi:hypothetical protein
VRLAESPVVSIHAAMALTRVLAQASSQVQDGQVGAHRQAPSSGGCVAVAGGVASLSSTSRTPPRWGLWRNATTTWLWPQLAVAIPVAGTNPCAATAAATAAAIDRCGQQYYYLEYLLPLTILIEHLLHHADIIIVNGLLAYCWGHSRHGCDDHGTTIVP